MPEPSARSIGLIGMPGGGKSTVGRHLAKRLGLDFIDTDALIEARVGTSIKALFEREGEESFRALESAVLNESIEGQSVVIATGGGIVLRETNRELLRAKSVCVYLRSTPEELYRRLRHDTKRPLLQVSDPLAKLRELYVTRDPLYRMACHYIVETGRPSVPTLVNMVLMQLELGGAL